MVVGIVLAAGRSTRMGGAHNKQFISLLGKPLVTYSLQAFEDCDAIDAVVLVRQPDHAAQTEEMVRTFGFRKVTAFAAGGLERQNSVWNGMALCPPKTEIVAVHDGARPLVTPALIRSTIESARAHGTGIAAAKVVDTIKEADSELRVSQTLDRTKLWAMQTPQTVNYALLKTAYQAVLDQHVVVTDEAAAVELLQEPAVQLVENPSLNLKVTTPSDLVEVEALLKNRSAAG